MYHKGNYAYPKMLQYVLDESFSAMKECGTEGSTMTVGTVKDPDTGRVFEVSIELSPVDKSGYEMSSLESFVPMLEPIDEPSN